MAYDRHAPDDPREWLNRSRSNLIRASLNEDGIYLEDLCFDAQQAAEKALKAVFVARSWTFPFVHDLALLLTLLQNAGEQIPPLVLSAAVLTEYAVVTRYPGLVGPVTIPEYETAVRIAEGVVEWATEIVAGLSTTG